MPDAVPAHADMILVEYYRLWDDNTWDTEFIPIPATTSQDLAHAAIVAAADKIEWTDDAPVAVGLYHWPNPDEEPNQDDAYARDEIHDDADCGD